MCHQNAKEKLKILRMGWRGYWIWLKIFKVSREWNSLSIIGCFGYFSWNPNKYSASLTIKLGENNWSLLLIVYNLLISLWNYSSVYKSRNLYWSYIYRLFLFMGLICKVSPKKNQLHLDIFCLISKNAMLGERRHAEQCIRSLILWLSFALWPRLTDYLTYYSQTSQVGS